MKTRILIGALSALSFGCLMLLTWIVLNRHNATALTPDNIGQGDYSMVMSDGQPFTEATMQGHPSLVFFGFTHCPDVCPTTLGDIALWQDELGKEAQDLRFYMISVDPERDTPEILSEYVGWIPGAYGVTGSPEESLKTQKAFRAYSRRVPLEGGDYTMDHSSMVMVFDRSGQFVSIISYQSAPDIALEKIRAVLGSAG